MENQGRRKKNVTGCRNSYSKVMQGIKYRMNKKWTNGEYDGNKENILGCSLKK